MNTFYNYHQITKEYYGEGIADESPLEPGVFLYPSNSTTIKPLEHVEGKVVVFDEEQSCWKYEDVQTHEDVQQELTYDIKRMMAYPSIGDQLDALFKAGIFPEEIASQIQAVKDKYPKPEGTV